MNKNELVAAVAEEAGIEKGKAQAAVDPGEETGKSLAH